jgi:endoglucanase
MLDSNYIGWHYWPYKKINNTRGIVTFARPAYYDSVIAYANTSRKNFEDIRKHQPANREEIEKAMAGFLQNCQFANCTQNEGYIKALGFVPRK